MRRVVVLLAVSFLPLGAIAGSARATTTIEQVSRTSSSGIAASPCTGEDIAFTTAVTSVFHYVLNPNGVARITSTVTLTGSATGLTSGTSYVSGGASHASTSFGPVRPQDFPVTSTLTSVLVGAGTAPNLLQHQVVLLHFDAQGNPTVDLVQSSFECKG